MLFFIFNNKWEESHHHCHHQCHHQMSSLVLYHNHHHILGLVAGAGYLQFHRKKKEDEQAMEGRFAMIMINMIIKIMIMIDSFKKFAFCVF